MSYHPEKYSQSIFDPMLPTSFDPWIVREEAIPLPGGNDSSDGYAWILFVGTTGAGKTTIVRQLLGTDPDRERFPSISAAKTTTCDIEIILDDGPLRAVVTVIPRDRARQYIAECVLAAVVSKMDGAPEQDVVRRFLEHSEQRFRLSYILGSQTLLRPTGADELEDDDLDDETESSALEDDGLDDTEREELLSALKNYFHEIDQLVKKAESVMKKTAGELGITMAEATKDEREALQELVEDQILNMERFHQLVDTILDDVESRTRVSRKMERNFGMGSIAGVSPEHWTRIKALSRRLGIFKVDEYDTLRPVADLIRLLQIHVTQFLSNP